MPWSRKSKPKAQRVVRRKKKDGTFVEYRYDAYKAQEADKDTIRSLIDAYQASVEWRVLSDSTKIHRAHYMRHLSALGPIPLDKLKRRQIIEIHDALHASIGYGSANGFLAAAKALFKWAISKDIIEHLPTMHIKELPGGHWRAWTTEEADAAEAGLPEPMRRIVILARHTGQRRADLVSLRWSQYDGSFIRLTQQKTKPGLKPSFVSIPVHKMPTLKAHLDAWKAEAKAVTILWNAHGRPWIANSITRLLPYYLASIGLEGLSIHGLRKLCATELANAGCSPHEIMAVCGWKTLEMAQLYTESADRVRLAEAAVVRLSEVRKKNSEIA